VRAEQLGDDDKVGRAPHEGGSERVPKDMGSGVVVEPGVGGDTGGDAVGAPDAQALTALVEEHCWAVLRAGPVRALGEPVGERFA
jgi:hypothetical protein